MWEKTLGSVAVLVAVSLLAAAPAAAQLNQPKPTGSDKLLPSKRPVAPPPSAAAPTGPDLSVRSVELAGLDGNRARLNVYLVQPGAGQHQDKVAVFWVEGSRRDKLWEGTSRFSGTRTGFMHQVNVDLPARRGTGHLEVVAGDRRSDPNWSNNVRRLELAGGDLAFVGGPQIEQRVGGNPNRSLRLKVRNGGPGAVGAGCKVELSLSLQGRTSTHNLALPALRPGQEHTVEHAFHKVGSSNDTAQARIVCADDLVASNNSTRLTLR